VRERILAPLARLSYVLEIGPGPGVLTTRLVQLADRVEAVELDPVWADYLQAEVLLEKGEAINHDVLDLDLKEILGKAPETRAVVSNMPYNITGPLLEKIREARAEFSVGVLMMQREVGEKILAKPGEKNHGALSVAMEWSFAVQSLGRVAPGCFYPPPKVDSIVLELEPRNVDEDESFLGTVRAGFAQPRKTLLNNLSASLGKTKGSVAEALTKAELPESVRPHQLTLPQWQQVHRWIAER
jgi:16S rRNA (adenine1518-N6/adenine1519-N6)-dimethyltransferase